MTSDARAKHATQDASEEMVADVYFCAPVLQLLLKAALVVLYETEHRYQGSKLEHDKHTPVKWCYERKQPRSVQHGRRTISVVLDEPQQAAKQATRRVETKHVTG